MNLTSVTRYLVLSLILVFSFQQGRTQPQLTKIKEWHVGNITTVSVDRIGNFFIVQKKGSIKKYDPNGKVIASLRKVNATLLEPWYHPTIFIYNRSNQTYLNYGRFFENVQILKLLPEYAIDPYLVCPTHDNRLWILDKADYSLKKINPLSRELLTEFPLPLEGSTPQFTYLKEYQNIIFLQEKNAIWIINSSLGNVIEKIESKQLGNFGFFGQEIYYLENNIIHFINLLTEDRYEIKLEGNTTFALVTDERVLTVSPDNKISLYNYVP